MSAKYTSSKKHRKQLREQRQRFLGEVGKWLPGTMEVGWLRDILFQAVEGFATEAGWRIALLLLEEELVRRCGTRYERPANREASRHGSQPGVIVIGGQKLPLHKPRARYLDGRGEVTLATYERLQHPDTMSQSALAKMVRGVSCRDYEGVLDLARAGVGVKKSSVSRGFVKASADELEKLMTRPLNTIRFVALFLDGIDFAGEMLIVAVGLDEHGHKHILGLRQGGTENAPVCLGLLTELRARGLDTSRPILVVLDGSKALVSAVKQVWGDRALIQRCQVHKKRNVKAHLPAEYHAELDRRLNAAYHGTDHDAALKQLRGTVTWLKRLNPDAASSLAEGLEETLTVVQLGLSETLRKTLATTNPIESALDTTRTVTRRVKRWRDGSMKQRWCAAGLLKVEKKFRRIKGYRDLPKLIAALDALVAKPSTPRPKKSA
jgi:putative transposase